MKKFKKIIPYLLFLFALCIFLYGIYPLIKMKLNTEITMPTDFTEVIENYKFYETDRDSLLYDYKDFIIIEDSEDIVDQDIKDNEDESVTPDEEKPIIIEKNYNLGDMFGTIQIGGFDRVIPIYYGELDNILELGAGIESRVLSVPGDNNNSVIYGHREEYFWNLQYTKIGDYIYINTKDYNMTFRIYEISILHPKDVYIYEESEKSIITLVTCYPFVWMGEVHSRYVVKAELIDIN